MENRGYPEVEAFAKAMKEKLAANAHKGTWKNESIEWLLHRLRQEVEELEVAAIWLWRSPWKEKEQTAEEVLQEAADVANFAMFIADVRGALKTKIRADRYDVTPQPGRFNA